MLLIVLSVVVALVAVVVWRFCRRNDGTTKNEVMDAELPSIDPGGASRGSGGMSRGLVNGLVVLDHMERREEFEKKPIKWSGLVDGPLPIKRLSVAQYSCLRDAVDGRRIYCTNQQGEFMSQIPVEVAFHPMRTVGPLLSHGFLAPDGCGGLVGTDFGARAYETLQAYR